MIRRILFALPLALLSLPALAQQADPAQSFADEWATIVASDTVSAAAHRHTAELAQRLVQAFQAQAAEVKKAKDEATATAAYWAAYVKGLPAPPAE